MKCFQFHSYNKLSTGNCLSFCRSFFAYLQQKSIAIKHIFIFFIVLHTLTGYTLVYCIRIYLKDTVEVLVDFLNDELSLHEVLAERI